MPSEQTGRVITATRRHVQICDDKTNVIKGKAASRNMDLCVGDIVLWTPDELEHSKKHERWEAVVEKVLPRKNCLFRSYGRKTKKLAANIDRIFIVTAPLPLFNTVVIDRILAAAYLEKIPCSLLVNKTDLVSDFEQTRPLIEIYRRIDVQILEVSAQTGEQFEKFTTALHDFELQVVLFCGISGVGKSTVLNALIPDIRAKTQEVSSRTGLGKQTTSQSYAYPFPRKDLPLLYLVDLPGIQNFGVCHLSETTIRDAFVEFRAHSLRCRFKNCWHIDEPECSVLEALSKGELSPLRHKSYIEMLKEIRSMKQY